MKLEVGMYAKTFDGINNVIDIKDDGIMTRFKNEFGNGFFLSEMLCNPSYNIIDLIEAGDYVNGEKVININGTLYVNNAGALDDIKIKTIVTKEQFESMEYKVEDK